MKFSGYSGCRAIANFVIFFQDKSFKTNLRLVRWTKAHA